MVHGQASIQTLLGGLLKNRQLVASMRRVMVMSLWEQVVGKMVAQKSWPEKIADGVLTVGVTSHAWSAELVMLKPQIISRYRQLLGRSVLKDVVFRIGKRRQGQADAGREASMALHPSPKDHLDHKPIPHKVLAEITNPEIRDLLLPTFAKLRAQREWKYEHGWAHCGSCQRIYHGISCPHCNNGPDAA